MYCVGVAENVGGESWQVYPFWGMDEHEGDDEDPISLHRYLYASTNPVNTVDPSGREGIIDTICTLAVQTTLFAMSHPILVSTVVAVGVALAPEDIQNALMATPGLSFEATVATEATELSEVAATYQKAKGSGLLTAGTSFGKWMASLLPGAETEIPVLNGTGTPNGAYLKGSAVVDALWKGVVFEFKTSAGAVNENQAIELAKFAAKQPMQQIRACAQITCTY